ncbi:hypothetical protein IQ07DRAFT_685687 [Pyrenochaeta sp. DS3sAY3a]|nr:hypothetical protein IQ07DRAFT_685687 [Pyrenochaeta sp. DS3sAY3a]
MMKHEEILQLDEIASFMTGDTDLWVANSFERLHLINLLAIQKRMIALEEEVNKYTEYDHYLNGYRANAPNIRDSQELLADLKIAIQDYSNATRSLAMIGNCNRADPHIIKALDDERPEISEFFKLLGDPKDYPSIARHHISVGAKPQDWLHKYVAKHERLARLFRVEQGNHKYTKFSEARLKKVEFGMVAICLCIVQLLPVLALTLVKSRAARLAIIIVLIVLVSTLNVVFSHTVRAANFGAIAAYSAVVVVFITQGN